MRSTPARPSGSRRDRARAATIEEIKAIALRLLAERGPTAVSLRAIAREMGLTAPALYRYFPSHDDLRDAVAADTCDRLDAVLTAALDGAGPDPCDRLVAAARAFRNWALAHPREFGLIIAPADHPGDTAVAAAVAAAAAAAVDTAAAAAVDTAAAAAVDTVADAQAPVNRPGRVGPVLEGVLAPIVAQLWSTHPFPVTAVDRLPAQLVSQLVVHRDRLVAQAGPTAGALPIGAVHAVVRAWAQLLGLVALEVHGHLPGALTDAGPFFEAGLGEIGASLGVERSIAPPGGADRP